jgi:cell pole-organizing protein PopZ
MGHGDEPSVEEILESIKKVIARDNRAGALEARRRREQAGEAADPVVFQHPTTAHNVRDEDEVLDLSEMEFAEDDLAPSAPVDAGEDAPLIADEVREAMQQNLSALAMLAEPGARPKIVRSGETSLEGLTRELLRPMLAEWLDSNLPDMVERMVQAEIARIVGKRL